MKREIEKRLADIERRKFDFAGQLNVVDYGVLEVDYKNGDWIELHHDNEITVVRHFETGEVRGYCFERRSDKQIEREGGLLEFL